MYVIVNSILFSHPVINFGKYSTFILGGGGAFEISGEGLEPSKLP